MFAIDTLKENPSFRMTGEEFNKFMNSLTEEKVDDSQKEVKLALVIRTANSNLVAYSNNSVVCTSPVDSHNLQGYFSVTATVRDVIEKLFPNVTFEDIKSTVLMPMGIYKQHGKLYVYMNLIIQDNQVEKFTSQDMTYRSISDLGSDFDLDSASQMVLSTLVITN